MNNQSMDYQELEFRVQTKSDKQKNSGFRAELSRVWNWIVEAIAASNEPKIYSRRSKSGKSYWEIYDPLLGRRVFFDFETEVRAWLDSRYYQ